MNWNHHRPISACIALLVAIAGWPAVVGYSFVNAQDTDPLQWSKNTITNLTLKIPLKDDRTELSGRVIAVDRDTGCLIETNAGQLHLVHWDDVSKSNNTDENFEPLSAEDLAELYEDPQSDQHALVSDHYVIVYRGHPAYAQWIVGLYERLYRGFYDYWERMGLKLVEPEFPLVVNVFASEAGFLNQASIDKLSNASSMIGYYHLFTNQTVSFDLTEAQNNRSNGRPLSKTALIKVIRSRPGAERTVATIVHESVHQLAYNSGLQIRLADNPLWLSEGIAMFFESPDLKSSTGWSGIGKTNLYQLNSFMALSIDNSEDWITGLIQNDDQFTDGATVNRAYARSWALTHYLTKVKPREFAAYLQDIGRGVPFEPTDAKRRLELFHQHFGADVMLIQNDLVKKLSKL